MKRAGFAQKPSKPMKRGYMKPKPKQGRKAAIAEADRLIQAVVLARDKHLCQRCGLKAVEGHHIIHKPVRPLRWDLRNVVSLCRPCHNFDATGYLKPWCISWLGGQEAYEALRLEGNTGTSEEPGDAITRLQKSLDK